MGNKLSRREFVGLGAVAAGASLAGTSVLPSAHQLFPTALRDVAPSDRVRFGMIGVGMQGSGLLGESIQLPGVECAAACDLYDGRHTLAREIVRADLPVTRRYRELLDNLSGAYEFVHIFTRETQAEMVAWTDLYAIVGPGRPLAPGEVTALRASLTHARMAHHTMIIAAVRIRQIADAYDLPYDRGTIAEYATTELREPRLPASSSQSVSAVF